jgi:hypothetical protein
VLDRFLSSLLPRTSEAFRSLPPLLARSIVCAICLFFGGGFWTFGAAQPASESVSQVYATAGFSQPVSPSQFKGFWQRGNHMSVGLGLERANVFVLRMGLRYNSFALDRAAVRVHEQLSDTIELPASDRYYLLGTTWDLLLEMPSPTRRLTPYVMVGLTLYYTDLSDMAIEDDLTGDDFEKIPQLGGSMNAGLGISHAVASDVDVLLEYALIGGFLGGDKKVFTPLSIGLVVHI